MHHVLIQMDHTHVNVNQVSLVMAAPVLILTSVAPIHVVAIKLAKTQSDRTNAYLVELE